MMVPAALLTPIAGNGDDPRDPTIDLWIRVHWHSFGDHFGCASVDGSADAVFTQEPVAAVYRPVGLIWSTVGTKSSWLTSTRTSLLSWRVRGRVAMR